MALVKCPECGKEVSSQLRKCNNCGYKLKQVDKKQRKKFIIIGVVLLALLMIGTVVGVNIKEKSDKEYHDKLVMVSGKMYVHGLISYLYCYNIGQVWYNTIWKKSDDKYDQYTKENYLGYEFFNSDFNDSISKYLTINEDRMNNLKKEQKAIEEMMTQLQKKRNSKYKDAYNKATELYSAFNGLFDKATSPSGSYNSYAEDYKKYMEDLETAYDDLVILIPELKDYQETD